MPSGTHIPIASPSTTHRLNILQHQQGSTTPQSLTISFTSGVNVGSLFASPVYDEQVANICRKDVCCYQQQWRR